MQTISTTLGLNKYSELDIDFSESDITDIVPNYHSVKIFYNCLKLKSRINVIIGGRGSLKTYETVSLLVHKAVHEDKNCIIIAGRLMADKLKFLRGEFLTVIRNHGYEDKFTFTNEKYICVETGVEIHFMSIIDEAELRGLSRVKYVIVDEARGITKSLMEALLPSVRVQGGECYFLFNPEHEHDYLYKHYVLYWDSMSEEEKDRINAEILAEADFSGQYDYATRIIWHNIDDAMQLEQELSQKYGKSIELLPNTLRIGYIDDKKRAEALNDDDTWAEFNHVWKGKCNYGSEGLVYYKKLESRSGQIEDFTKVIDERGRAKYLFKGQKVRLEIGADWGEKNDPHVFIISFDYTYEQVVTRNMPDGSIKEYRLKVVDCYIIGELYFAGNKHRDYGDFGYATAHYVYNVLSNTDNFAGIIDHKLQVVGDTLPSHMNMDLRRLGLNIEDVKKIDPSGNRSYKDYSVNWLRREYRKYIVYKDLCPKFEEECRSYRRELVPDPIGNTKEPKMKFEYYGNQHCLDAWRYSKSDKMQHEDNTATLKPVKSPMEQRKKINESIDYQNIRSSNFDRQIMQLSRTSKTWQNFHQ